MAKILDGLRRLTPALAFGFLCGILPAVLARLAMRVIAVHAAGQGGFSIIGSGSILLAGMGLGGLLSLWYTRLRLHVSPEAGVFARGAQYSLLLFAMSIPFYPFGPIGNVIQQPLAAQLLFGAAPWLYGFSISLTREKLSGERLVVALFDGLKWRAVGWGVVSVVVLALGAALVVHTYMVGIAGQVFMRAGLVARFIVSRGRLFGAVTTQLTGAIVLILLPAVIVGVLYLTLVPRQPHRRPLWQGGALGLVTFLAFSPAALIDLPNHIDPTIWIFGLVLVAALLLVVGFSVTWLVPLRADGETRDLRRLRVLTLLASLAGIAWLVALNLV